MLLNRHHEHATWNAIKEADSSYAVKPMYIWGQITKNSHNRVGSHPGQLKSTYSAPQASYFSYFDEAALNNLTKRQEALDWGYSQLATVMTSLLMFSPTTDWPHKLKPYRYFLIAFPWTEASMPSTISKSIGSGFSRSSHDPIGIP
jgi:hypothetical protein